LKTEARAAGALGAFSRARWAEQEIGRYLLAGYRHCAIQGPTGTLTEAFRWEWAPVSPSLPKRCCSRGPDTTNSWPTIWRSSNA